MLLRGTWCLWYNINKLKLSSVQLTWMNTMLPIKVIYYIYGCLVLSGHLNEFSKRCMLCKSFDKKLAWIILTPPFNESAFSINDCFNEIWNIDKSELDDLYLFRTLADFRNFMVLWNIDLTLVVKFRSGVKGTHIWRLQDCGNCNSYLCLPFIHA